MSFAVEGGGPTPLRGEGAPQLVPGQWEYEVQGPLQIANAQQP